MSAEQMARKLDRTPETVRRWIREHIGGEVAPVPSGVAPGEDTPRPNLPAPPPEPVTPPTPSSVLSTLKRSTAYKNLREQFTPQEIRFFEEKYQDYVSQFNEDVFATEQSQIFLLIKFEILIDRNLKEKHRALTGLERISAHQDNLRDLHEDPMEMTEEEREQVVRLAEQATAGRLIMQKLSDELIKLEEKHQAILKDLKATRAERIQRIESSRQTFLGLLRQIDDEEERQRLGRHMEVIRRATEQEARRLSTPHRYEDGQWDQPLLNAETSVFREEVASERDSPAQPDLLDNPSSPMPAPPSMTVSMQFVRKPAQEPLP